MNLFSFKKYFFSELSTSFPKTEIQSFFNILIEHTLKLSRVEIALNPAVEISKTHLYFLQKALSSLKKSIPIQYIIGETAFYGLTFKVSKNVLIPRPETEELVNWVLNDTKHIDNINILDIGTGSGCIAISIAKNIPNTKVYALDISSKALKIAKENAKLNNVNIEFIEADILNFTKPNKKFDIIISNPPYVRELEKEQMQKNVLANEPHLALFVKNENPLLFYNKIADFAVANLKQNGSIYFEINQYLGKETVSLLKSKEFKNIKLKKDIFGVHRMLKATII
ncbi:protein-(glutamine-N5) methyltransferase, release factor-specific [Lutibacter profundi]|uniref:Release factor glutamine methyltransferase n=1 Tax=Lutibacter profundi TaxID=1622118 RepID=A0A0X8G8T6_9FLAO|nr:peptide chain release factor N(5)-glutamine methyltransferase [Lutibacter profundi]AMC12126.1 protein-(glutamine-N5) methyltransferase, release factor-specific [Lutibacter profundi]